jgi:hypothetical protein
MSKLNRIWLKEEYEATASTPTCSQLRWSTPLQFWVRLRPRVSKGTETCVSSRLTSPPLQSCFLVPAATAGSRGQVGGHGSPPVVHDKNVDVNHDEESPLQLRHIDDIFKPVSPRGLAQQVPMEELHAVSLDEPYSFYEAE